MSEFKQQGVVPATFDYLIRLDSPSDASSAIPDSFILNKDTMIIGRAEGVDIRLQHGSISRQHARLIRTEDGDYTITDLNSTHGVYVENYRIEAESETPLPIGATLRLGDILLQIAPPPPIAVDADSELNAVADAIAGAMPADQPVVTELDAFSQPIVAPFDTATESLRAILIPPSITLAPGSTGSIVLDLVNSSRRDEHFVLEITGIPRNWLSLPRHSIFMEKQTSQLLSIPLHPPRLSNSLVGDHTFTVTIRGLTHTELVSTVQGQIKLTGFLDFEVYLRPDHVENNQLTRIEIHNRGNIADSYTLLHPNDAVPVAYPAPEEAFTVLPDQQHEINILLRSTHHPQWLREQYKGFAVTVQSQGTNQIKNVQGFIAIPPRLSATMIAAGVAALLLCSVLTGLGIMGSMLFAPLSATDQTQTALAMIPTVDDVDGDGLSANEEATRGTLPDIADSDNDGLSDGDEVNRVGTNPLDADSDNDTLIDGQEITIHGSDPLLADTDGDGLSDRAELEIGSDLLDPDTDDDAILDGDDPFPLVAYNLTDSLDFVAYYYALINADRLDLAYDLLSERFIRENRLTEASYAAWWAQVDAVTLTQSELLTQDDFFACILTDLTYQMRDGTRMADPFPVINLVRDAAGTRWQLDSKISLQHH